MLLASAAQMRACDRAAMELGIPGPALMESAGRAAALLLRPRLGPRPKKVRVLCGAGNNGGDGFVVARYLLGWEVEVEVVLVTPRAKTQGDALLHLAALERLLPLCPRGRLVYLGDALAPDEDARPHLDALGHAHVLVDALLGTGLDRELRGPLRAAIEHLNAQEDALVFSLDLPSGLHADTGQPLGAVVRADLTATFALAKPGLWLYPGRALAGEIHVLDIGIPAQLYAQAKLQTQTLTQDDARALLPARPASSHKNTYGHVLAVGGAPGKGGALALGARAALRAGAGLVTAAGLQDAPHLAPHPELMSLPALPFTPDLATALLEALPSKVLLLGPGLGTTPDAAALLTLLLDHADAPCVLDADALNLLAADGPEAGAERLRALSARVPVVLTPHPGEFARLTGLPARAILQDSLAASRRLAQQTGCVTLCKTAATVVAHPNGWAAINTSGNPGMATAGSGDVLGGILAALLAQHLDPWDAARLGVFLHGRAGDLAATRRDPRALVAGDLIEHLGEALASCHTTT